jgi:glycerol-3-phosphate acyltransferase PlsY
VNRQIFSTPVIIAALPILAAAVIAAFFTLGDQPPAVQYAVVALLSYLLGSIPVGYLLLRARSGVDVRDYGSGRTGMSNVLRTGGGKLAAVTLTMDIAKGALAVVLARYLTGANGAEVAAGLLVLVGHNWPIFLQFKGGRGILTALGGLSVMAPVPAVIATITFLVITFLSRYISLGSIIGVLFGCFSLLALVLVGVYSSAYALYALVGTVIIIWQHRDNIRRIYQGNERRLGHPAP